MNIKGNVFKYGDNVDTDVIIPARYLNVSDAKHLSEHCMEDIDADFVSKVKEGDVMVGGFNFGCGSSREHAPIAIKASGISVVIAKSFARIFYRNAINIGLPILECPACVDEAESGDVIEADLSAGVVKNVTKGKEYKTVPFPKFIQEIIDLGGLTAYAKAKLS